MVASNWRPDRSREERLSRSIQSMIPGTGAGRIAVARPVRSGSNGIDIGDEDDEITDDEGNAAERFLPWTDRFVINSGPGGKILSLSHNPWSYPEGYKISGRDANEWLHGMGIYPGQVTLHLYWNGVFQPDSSWYMPRGGSSIYVFDNENRIKNGDEFIAKYFLQVGGRSGPGLMPSFLQVRHTGSSATMTVTAAEIPQMNLFGGALSGFSPGGDVIYGTYWDNKWFGTTQNWAFRKKPNTPPMPVDRALEWYVGVTTSAEVRVHGVLAKAGEPTGVGSGFYERCTIWPFGFRNRDRNKLIGPAYAVDGIPTNGPFVDSEGGSIRVPFTDSQAKALQGLMNGGGSSTISMRSVGPVGIPDQRCPGRDTGSWPGPCNAEPCDFHVSGLHAEGVSGAGSGQASDPGILAVDPGGTDFEWPEDE